MTSPIHSGLTGTISQVANALIPIIYFLFKNSDVTLRGSTPFDARNADRIRRWLIMSLLNGAFGGASDNLLRDLRTTIAAAATPGSDFPLDAIQQTMAKVGRPVQFDDYAIHDLLNLTYGGQQTFLALSLLYDDATWGTMQFHQDHLFARSSFKPKELAVLNRSDWLGKQDRLGNLCLLLGTENVGKKDMPIDEWLESREPNFLHRHLIPDDKSLWKFERFPDFLYAREQLITGRLKTLFSP